jgi:hypothetical protein
MRSSRSCDAQVRTIECTKHAIKMNLKLRMLLQTAIVMSRGPSSWTECGYDSAHRSCKVPHTEELGPSWRAGALVDGVDA